MSSSLRSSFKLLAVGLLAIGAGSATSDARAETRVGVVQLQYAISQTEDGIRATNTLKKVFDKKQQDLDARQSELEKMKGDITKQTQILSREALTRRMEDWQKRMVDLQSVFVEHNKELQKRQADLMNPIMKKMMGAIKRVASKNGYDVIVDATAALYFRQDLDVTDQVIQQYNGGGSGGDDAEKKDDKEKKDAPKEEPKEAPKDAPKDAPKP